MAGEIDARLEELGIEVPEPAAPVANYVAYVISGNLIFVSGQVPIQGGEFQYVGKVGGELTVEDGQAAARLCGINIIAQVKQALGGDLDRVTRVVKLGGFVAWLIWLSVHIYFLTGFKNRLFVVLQWAWSYLTYHRGARLILGKSWRAYPEDG